MEQNNKRYSEPKRIGEIINDMKIPALVRKYNEMYAESIMDSIASYGVKINALEYFYVKASDIANEFDEFLHTEIKIFADYKQLAIKGRLMSQDIFTHIHAIEITMRNFDHRQSNIRHSLRNITDAFASEDDRDEHHTKINDFCYLFREMYNDMDDLMHEFGNLRKIL